MLPYKIQSHHSFYKFGHERIILHFDHDIHTFQIRDLKELYMILIKQF